MGTNGKGVNSIFLSGLQHTTPTAAIFNIYHIGFSRNYQVYILKIFTNSSEHERNEKSDYANLFAIGCIFISEWAECPLASDLSCECSESACNARVCGLLFGTSGTVTRFTNSSEHERNEKSDYANILFTGCKLRYRDRYSRIRL